MARRRIARSGHRKLLFVASTLAWVMATGAVPPASGQESPPPVDDLGLEEDIPPPPEPRPEIRLRGEVVETACFIMGNRRGAEHRQCAIASARAGQDLGVLDEKSKQLYVAIVDRRDAGAENPLLPFIAHRVDVRGELLEYGDLPALIVTNVKSLRAPK